MSQPRVLATAIDDGSFVLRREGGHSAVRRPRSSRERAGRGLGCRAGGPWGNELPGHAKLRRADRGGVYVSVARLSKLVHGAPKVGYFLALRHTSRVDSRSRALLFQNIREMQNHKKKNRTLTSF